MDRRFSLDHHLQSQIVQQLMMQGEQTFSELKPAGIENSLFMYHMRKLITRGIAEKAANGFQLTPHGARWANKTGSALHQIELPRPRVQLIVLMGETMLIAERTEHLAKHMNRYMLPGTFHRFGETSRQTAERICSRLGLTLTSSCVGRTEIILPAKQLHTIVDLYTAAAPRPDYMFDDADNLLHIRFMPVDTVLAMTDDEANALPQIVKAFVAKTAYKDAYLL